MSRLDATAQIELSKDLKGIDTMIHDISGFNINLEAKDISPEILDKIYSLLSKYHCGYHPRIHCHGRVIEAEPERLD